MAGPARTGHVGGRRPPGPRSSEARRAARHLATADPVLAKLVRRCGPLELRRHPGGFPTLVRSIVFQQISGAAGAAILRRLRSIDGGSELPPPAWFVRAEEEVLARAGLSPQKRRYIRDLADRVHSGRLDLSRLAEAPDPDVIASLTEVHGIGVWTAQMYLIFALNRPDVLPSGDLGLRKAVADAWGYRALPAPRTVERLGRAWAPYRSYAAEYLWASLDDRGRPGPPTPRAEEGSGASAGSAGSRGGRRSTGSGPSRSRRSSGRARRGPTR